MSRDPKSVSWKKDAHRTFGEPLFPEPGEIGQEQVSGYEKDVKLAVDSRRFFVTSNGYVGLAPAEAQTGDIVCVFLGADTPYLLRRVVDPSWFTLVGSCFLTGAQEGEAVRHIHPSRLLAVNPQYPLEDFNIF